MKNLIVAALVVVSSLVSVTAFAQDKAVTMPTLRVVAPKPVRCTVKALEQGGRPGAQTVTVCG
jgi:hypothetical protein